MNPSSVLAGCPVCGVRPGSALGYRCLCHQTDYRAMWESEKEGNQQAREALRAIVSDRHLRGRTDTWEQVVYRHVAVARDTLKGGTP